MTPALAFLALIVTASSSSSTAPAGLADAGLRAATEHRYCDASLIFVQVHGHTRDPLALYRAAETAYAADDRLSALRLYRTLLDTHRAFDRAAIVEQRIGELLGLLRDKGPGTTCTTPPRVCGDWIVSSGEACDDGNLTDGDGCDGTCMPSGCGNGNVTGDEVCDDGNPINGDGCDDNCTLSACGNGVTGPGETCDDGNDTDGDGCDHTCTVSSCGNSVRAGDEACDDGNTSNGDGCSAGCRQEAPPSPLPLLLGSAGAGAVVVGGALAMVGSLPFFAHQDARSDVIAAEETARLDAQVGLEAASEAQARQVTARTDFDTWGLPLLGGGFALASVGVVMGAVGVAMGVGLIDLSEELPFAPDQRAPAATPPPPTTPAAVSPTATPGVDPATAPAPIAGGGR